MAVSASAPPAPVRVCLLTAPKFKSVRFGSYILF